MTQDEEELLLQFYNFCMDEYNGMCKEEAVYEFLQTKIPKEYKPLSQRVEELGDKIDRIAEINNLQTF